VVVEQVEAVEPPGGEIVVAGIESAAPILAAIRGEADLVDGIDNLSVVVLENLDFPDYVFGLNLLYCIKSLYG